MNLRPFLYAPTACASYLFGCPTHARLAVVDPHVQLVDAYVLEAEQIGRPLAAAPTDQAAIIAANRAGWPRVAV